MESNQLHQLLFSIESAISIDDKIARLNDLAWYYKKTSKFDEVIAVSEQIFETLKENPNVLQQGRILNTLGVMYMDQGHFSISLEKYEEAFTLFKSIDNKEFLSVILNNLGTIHRIKSNFIESIEYYKQSIKISEEFGFNHSLTSSLMNLGNVYRNLKEFTAAVEYYEKALQISTQCNYLEGISNVLGNLGNVYLDLKQYDKSLNFHFRSLDLSKQLDDLSSVAIDYGNIGTVYLELLDYYKAIEFFLQSLAITEQLENINSSAIKYTNLGVIYGTPEFEGYNFETALEYSKKALEIFESIDNKSLQLTTHKNIADILKHAKSWEDYSYHIEKHHQLHSEILNDKVLEYVKKYNFERKEAEREKELAIINAKAKERSKILEDILPKEIINRLINGETKIADSYDNVSLLFLDIVGFTQLTETVSAIELVDILDSIFGKFDSICKKYSVEKIKTIGDAYLAVAGATIPSNNPSVDIAKVACEIQTLSINDVNISSDVLLQFRIGLHKGNVVAGIIGEEKYSYDIWGDAVNVASRMESHSEAGRIHISDAFAKSIEHHSEFKIISRGEINIKGKGTMKTFWLERAG